MITKNFSALRTLTVTAFLLALVVLGVHPANAQTTNDKIPVMIPVNIPCANGGEGEIVMMSGMLHVLIHTSTNAEGCVTMKTHFQPQQLTGTGSVTGAKYQGTGVTQSTTHEKTNCGDGCIIEENFVNNFRMIGQGPGNNFTVHSNTRIIYNVCTEETTVVVENASVECF